MVQRPSPPDDLELWTSVDEYYRALLLAPDPVLERALADSRASALPDIQVSPLQGMFLYLLARIQKARRILEIGTLGGYSTLWLARALPPDGYLLTLEANPKHAEVARANIARAGLQQTVHVKLGAALESLRTLAGEESAPYDLIFIDADKVSYPDYLERAVALSRSGSVIVADNVVRRGDIVHSASEDPSVRGVRAMNDRIAGNHRLRATVIQTVGAKGYDGFTLALVE